MENNIPVEFGLPLVDTFTPSVICSTLYHHPFGEFWMHLPQLDIHIFKENDYRTITLDTSYDAFPAASCRQPTPRNKSKSFLSSSLFVKIF